VEVEVEVVEVAMEVEDMGVEAMEGEEAIEGDIGEATAAAGAGIGYGLVVFL